MNGRTVYLGRYGSPASREKHARIVREAASDAPTPAAARPVVDPHAVTVAAVLAAFWTHAKTAYDYHPSYDGKRPPSEIGNYHDAMRPVLKLFASTPAVEFGPASLRLVQEEIIAADLCRNVVNRHTSRVKQMFRWAGSVQMIPGSVNENLRTVGAVTRRHKGVRNTAKVRPVSAADLAATLHHLSPTVRAMAELQALTGMRSSELLAIRTSGVERPAAGGNWTYRPRTHKTEHHGHDQTYGIGRRGQAVLLPFLRPDEPEAFVFSPARAAAERRAVQSAARVTPLTTGNRPGDRPAKRSPRRAAGEQYTRRTYAQAIARGVDKANAAAVAAAGPDADPSKVPTVGHWHLHQLRHNWATVVRAAHGLDGAKAVLGHRSATMAAMYAELDGAKAERIVAELG